MAVVGLLVVANLALLMGAVPVAAHAPGTLGDPSQFNANPSAIGAGSAVAERLVTVTLSNSASSGIGAGEDQSFDEVRFSAPSNRLTWNTGSSAGWTPGISTAGGTTTLAFTGDIIPEGVNEVFDLSFGILNMPAAGTTFDITVTGLHTDNTASHTDTIEVTIDNTLPQLMSLRTLDMDNDGHVDCLVYVFGDGSATSDDIEDTTVELRDFFLEGRQATSFETRTDTDDNEFSIGFPDLLAADTSLLPANAFYGGTLTNVFGNLAPSEAFAANADILEDGAGPAAIAAVGQSTSTQVIFYFSEGLELGNDALEPTDFIFDGGAAGDGIDSVAALVTGANHVVLTLDVALGGGTHTLRLADGDVITDAAGNDGKSNEVTIAAPAIAKVLGQVGSDQAIVVFNGPVDDGEATPAGLVLADFSLSPAVGGGPSGILSVDHEPGSELAFLTLNAPLEAADVAGGGDGLKVNLDADAAFAHQSDIAVAASTVEVVDETGPSIVGIETIGDGMGSLKGLAVDFDEPLDVGGSSDLDESLWAIEGVGAPTDASTHEAGGAGGPTTGVTRVFLLFDGDAAGFDTGSTPVVDFLGGLPDLSPGGNLAPAERRVASTDAAPPIALGFTTVDLDTDGRTDGVEMVASEPLDDSTFAANEWSVEDDDMVWTGSSAPQATGIGFDTGDTPDDDTISITYTEDGVLDTGITPLVTYDPTATLSDLAGVDMEAFGPMAADDGVAPVLADVRAAVGAKQVVAAFSEPVKRSSAGGMGEDLPLGKNAFTFTNGATGGATAIQAADHSLTDGPSEVVLTLDAAVAAADIDTDAIKVVSGAIKGRDDGVTVPANQRVLNDDAGTALITDVLALDRNEDGWIDALQVTFDRDLDDADRGTMNLNAADWTLGAPFGNAMGNPTSVVTQLAGTMGGEDDDTLFVLFDAETMEHPDGDTAMTPTVLYSGTLLALDGTPVAASTAIESDDGAKPVLIRASGNPGQKEVDLTFSEGVRGSGASNALSVGDLVYLNGNGAGASNIAALTHTAGAATAQLTLNVKLLATGGDHGPGGDTIRARSTVMETADAGGKKLNGALPAINLVDVEAPLVVAIRTLDGANGATAGRIDALEVEFNEPVNDDLNRLEWITEAPYANGDGHPVSVSTGDVANDHLIVLRLNEQPDVDTDFRPLVSYEAMGTIEDLIGGNVLADFEDLQSEDGAAPVLLSITTDDTDADGELDGILATFSEAIDDDSFDVDEWTVTDTSGTWDEAEATLGNDLQGTEDDAEIRIPFTPAGMADTHLELDVDYMPTGTLTDLHGNGVAAIAATAADGAPAVITALGGIIGSTTAELRFSEPVCRTGGGAITASSLQYTNLASGGSTSIDSVAHADGDTVAAVELDAALTTGDFDSDTIGAGLETIREARDGCAGDSLFTPETAISFVDLAAPSVELVRTLDTDGDGRVDTLEVRLDQDILDEVGGTSQLEPGDWTVTRDDDTEVTPTAATSSLAAGPPAADVDDDTFFLMIPEATDPDTGATFTAAYTPGDGGRIQNHAGDLLGATEETTQDGAGPRFLTAHTRDLDADGRLDAYEITATEPLDDSTFLASEWGVAGFDLQGFDTGLTPDDDTFLVRLTEPTAADTAITPDVTFTSTGAFEDLAGNAATDVAAGAGAMGLVEEDGAAPALVRILTNDDDADGFLEYLTVILSEAIVDSVSLDREEWSLPDPLGDDDGHPAAISTAAFANDDTLDLVLPDPADGDPFNTGSRPVVSYAPLATLQDAHGNELGASSLRATDNALPVLVSMRARDFDGDQFIDTIEVEVSENLDDVDTGGDGNTLDRTEWTLPDPYGDAADRPTSISTRAPGSAPSSGNDDRFIFLGFNENDALSADTGGMAGIGLALGTRLQDQAGLYLGGFASRDALDGVLPEVLSAVTGDDDDNLFIDHYVVTMTEPIDDSSFDEMEFNVAGTDVVGLDTGDTADDAVFKVLFLEDGALGTGALPELTYTPSGTLSDLAGNGLEAIAADDLTEEDGVPAKLLQARAVGLGDINVVLDFSESIRKVGGGAITLADLVYDDVSGDGASALAGTPVHTGKTLDVDLNVGLAESDNGLDTVAPLGGALEDLAGNAVDTTAVVVEADTTPPSPVFDLAPATDGIGVRSVVLEWTTPSEPDIVNLEIRFDTSAITDDGFGSAPGVLTVSAPTPGAVQQATVNGLAPDADHFFRIAANDAAGNQATPSNEVIAKTLADTVAPGAFTPAIVPGTLFGDRATISWNAPANDGAAVGGAADNYELRISTTELTADNFATTGDPITGVPAPAAPGTSQQVALTSLTPSTMYYVAGRATDDQGNVGDVGAILEFTTTNDSTPPTGSLVVSSTTHPTSAATNAGDASFSWSALTDDESTVTYRYALRDAASYVVTSADTLATGTTASFTNVGQGTSFFHVAAFSNGGVVQAAAYPINVDSVAPAAPGAFVIVEDSITTNSVTFSWTAPGDDGAVGTAAEYEMRFGAGLDAAGFADGTLIDGLGAPQAAGTGESIQIISLPAGSQLVFGLRALDEVGNAGPIAFLTVDLEGDDTPPTGAVVISSLTHPEGEATQSSAATLRWTGGVDPESTVVYRFVLNQQRTTTVTIDDTLATGTSQTFAALAPGEHCLHVRAFSAGGAGEQDTYCFTVDELTGAEIEAANKAATFGASRDGDTNVVTFSPPSDPPAPIMGAQVHVMNSPYTLVATLEAGDQAFIDGRFVHSGSDARETSRYLVTFYYGETAEEGFFTPTDSADDTVYPGTAVVVPGGGGSDSGSSDTLGWFLVALAVIVVLALIIAAIVLAQRRRSGDQHYEAVEDEAFDQVADDGAWDDDSWDDGDWATADDQPQAWEAPEPVAPTPAAAADPHEAPTYTAEVEGGAPLQQVQEEATDGRHDLTCPQCATDFAVEGQRPLLTTCPGCGVRGVLD
ncbi:MAG: hypothetical protein ACPGQL_09890 [Thermoplasmatota archaeon]